MQKLYCFVDETGQDTKGEFFLVTVVVAQKEKEQLEKIIHALEEKSGKHSQKWHKSSFDIRNAFLDSLFSNTLFQGKIFFSSYRSDAYVELTILTVAKTILHCAVPPYKATIIVDGLRKNELHHFSSGLRKLNIRMRKVRGAREQSNGLIRLADAMAGFLRDYHEQEAYTKDLMNRALECGIVHEI